MVGDLKVDPVELTAPSGWKKKFTPKKAGTPKRNDIVFISPSGDEMRNKKQLGQYLRSHPGGPSFSEFDWGSGETPRRSARISEKIKEAETLEQEPPKKRGRISASKKGITQKNGVDEQEEVEAPESKELATEALQVIEDTKMKDVEDGSLGEKDVGAAKAIIEDNSKVDSNEGTNQENVDNEAPKDDVDTKDAAASSLNEGKLDSFEGIKNEKKNINAGVEDYAPQSKDMLTQAIETKDHIDIIHDVNDSVKEGNEVATAEVIMKDSSSKVDSNEKTKQENYKLEQSVEDVNLIDANDSSAKVYSNDKKGLNQDFPLNPAGKEENEKEKMLQKEQGKQVTVISIPEAYQEENELKRENQVESAVLAYEAKSFKENLHGGEVNDTKKGEQVSPSKSIPTANRVDLPSPQKASAIV